MSVFEMAKNYYPVLWSKDRLIALVQNDPPRLTAEQYQQITGEAYSA
ncbi:MAG: XkdX family protein [Oscillibacter sp.]|nr:XkdX family protein [Oscillibacter sp.]MEA4992354.1 XkdX family protein [Oscillibacter sp.]